MNVTCLNHLQDLCKFNESTNYHIWKNYKIYQSSCHDTQVCSNMSKDEHINSIDKVILEINKQNDAKYLAEIIHIHQRKLFECENKRWKN